MIDMVPKAITLTLVSYSKHNLQNELLKELYKPDVLDELLKESEFVVNRRKEVVSMVQALNKAEECVSFSCSRSFRVTRRLTDANTLIGSLRECRRVEEYTVAIRSLFCSVASKHRICSSPLSLFLPLMHKLFLLSFQPSFSCFFFFSYASHIMNVCINFTVLNCNCTWLGECGYTRHATQKSCASMTT